MSKPNSSFLENAIYLVDASSYIFRAYYGIQSELKAPDGTPTHATYGFLQMIKSLQKEYRVQRLMLVWDQKDKGFRHKIYPEYKANRSQPPEDLSLQIENTRKAADILGIPQIDVSQYEADDILASIITKFKNLNFVIVTSDKDLLQLVNERVWCLDTLKKKWSNTQEAFDKFGVSPDKISLVQALCGDAVDNIPGATGIGPKTATEWINAYQTLEDLYKAADEIQTQKRAPEKNLKGKKLENLLNSKANVELSLQLVCLEQDIPLNIDVHVFDTQPVEIEALKEFSEKFAFKKLMEDWIPYVQLKNPSQNSVDASTVFKQGSFQAYTLASINEIEELFSSHAFLNADVLCLDTETRSLSVMNDCNLVGISLCFDQAKSYYIPLRHGAFDEKECIKKLAFLKDKLFANENKRFIFQNLKFDAHILIREAFNIPWDKVEDTMLMSFVINPSQRHGMDALSSQYLDAYQTMSFSEVLGDFKSFDQVPIDKATYYAAEDAWVTLQLYFKLSEELETLGLTKIYKDLDLNLVQVLCEMEEKGVMLNLNFLSTLSEQLQEEKNV